VAFLTFAELAVSPLNVRTNVEDAEATDALEASIAAVGLLQPLVVHPLTLAQLVDDGDDARVGRFGVLAGGRRLRAIGKLIGRGELPADWPIACVVRDITDAEITEASLAENLLRRELRPYEVHAAIQRAHAQGATAEDIAGQLGQRVVWVRQQLRLGGLDPAIFAAYAAGEVSIEDARAYAATEDLALQRAAFARFGTSRPYAREREIRAFLKIGDRELERLLKFVGAEAYRAAGGRFELDLFADGPERGRVVDEGKLRELAEERLEQERAKVRERAGRPDLRFLAQPPQRHGCNDRDLELLIERKRNRYVLPEGEIGATLAIDEAGNAQLRWWWASGKAKRDYLATLKADLARQDAAEGRTPKEPPPEPAPIALDAGLNPTMNYAGAQAAKAAVRDGHGLSADGLNVVRSLRRELLRALLVTDADSGATLGRDYIVWAQLRHELTRDRETATGARSLDREPWTADQAEPREVVADWLDGTEAHKLWAEELAFVSAHPAFALADPAEAFAAFDQADERFRARAGAVLAGIALLRSANVDGYRIAVHDKLAALACGHDAILRELWAPTPAFLGLFPKLKRLELVRDAGAADQETTTRWSKLKDRDLSQACAEALAAREGWVHPLLSFNASGEEDEGSGEHVEPELEAAE
jgi:ParB family chromosome partitioning protein